MDIQSVIVHNVSGEIYVSKNSLHSFIEGYPKVYKMEILDKNSSLDQIKDGSDIGVFNGVNYENKCREKEQELAQLKKKSSTDEANISAIITQLKKEFLETLQTKLASEKEEFKTQLALEKEVFETKLALEKEEIETKFALEKEEFKTQLALQTKENAEIKTQLALVLKENAEIKALLKEVEPVARAFTINDIYSAFDTKLILNTSNIPDWFLSVKSIKKFIISSTPTRNDLSHYVFEDEKELENLYKVVEKLLVNIKKCIVWVQEQLKKEKSSLKALNKALFEKENKKRKEQKAKDNNM
ncbi:hypothetical protein ABK040_000480 [Willaertia magna]